MFSYTKRKHLKLNEQNIQTWKAHDEGQYIVFGQVRNDILSTEREKSNSTLFYDTCWVSLVFHLIYKIDY